MVGTELHVMGWRIDQRVAADGPGTTLFGIRRGAVFCVIYEAQPAYLDDDGEIVSSDTLTITIQCRQE
jgi:hypothetical protein